MTWAEGVQFASMLSALCAVVALIFNAYSTLQASKTRELDVFHRAYGNILQLEEKLLDASAQGADARKALAWRAAFLNALEYFAFLVNRRFLCDPELREYLARAVVHWYETIFLKAASKEETQDPEIYPELKALFFRITAAVRSGTSG